MFNSVQSQSFKEIVFIMENLHLKVHFKSKLNLKINEFCLINNSTINIDQFLLFLQPDSNFFS